MLSNDFLYDSRLSAGNQSNVTTQSYEEDISGFTHNTILVSVSDSQVPTQRKGGAGGPPGSPRLGWFGALPSLGLAQPFEATWPRGLADSPDVEAKEGSYS